MLGKNRLINVRKHVFYIHTNIVTKKLGGERAKQFFQKNTNSASKKKLGKKSSQKSAKTRFLYSHGNRDQQMWGKKHAKQFFQKHTISASKICWEKDRLKKLRKHVFHIHINIVTKKWGGK